MTRRRLLLIGGGHSHVEVLRQQALAKDPDVATTLVSPAPLTPYSGMLPGLVAGLYDIDETHIALRPLAAAAGARLVEDRVVGLDLDARLAHLAQGGAVPFDTVSLDIGSVPAAPMPGAQEHAVGVKPVDQFLQAWDATIAAARGGRVGSLAVVGGGAGGIEILFAMQARLAAAIGAAIPRFALVTDLPHLLPRHAPAVRRRVQRILAARAITVHFDAQRRRHRARRGDRARRSPHRCGPDRPRHDRRRGCVARRIRSRVRRCRIRHGRRAPALAVAPVRVRRR